MTEMSDYAKHIPACCAFGADKCSGVSEISTPAIDAAAPDLIPMDGRIQPNYLDNNFRICGRPTGYRRAEKYADIRRRPRANSGRIAGQWRAGTLSVAIHSCT